MTCEISVKTHTVFFFFSLSSLCISFINWCPTLKARDLWFIYLRYCLGIHSRSACSNVRNSKLLSLSARPAPVPSQCWSGTAARRRTACGAQPFPARAKHPSFIHSFNSRPRPGVSSAGELSKSNISKGAEVMWDVGHTAGKGSRELHWAESATPSQHAGLALKSCARTCNLAGCPRPFSIIREPTLLIWS